MPIEVSISSLCRKRNIEIWIHRLLVKVFSLIETIPANSGMGSFSSKISRRLPLQMIN